jgi:Fic-DOC domain mobile mystery protein B
MGLDLDYIDGQPPLNEEEKEGLLIKTIATQGELDEFEQQNIEQAVLWSLGRNFKVETLFSETFVKDLHKRMYGNVWVWAGQFRKRNKNLGVDKWQIQTELKYLLDNAMYWHQNETYNPDELTLRLKHKLVSIHCFANGNGRHSRLYADIIIEKLFKLPHFTWGANNLIKQSENRSTYINAVRTADNGDIKPLIKFART